MKLENYVEKLKNKDEDAFETIYKQTQHGVFALIVGIVKDRNLAEDLMQETYIEMIKSINSYQKKYKFINWLLTIARNKAIDEYRRRKRELKIDINDSQFNLSTNATQDHDVEADYLLSLLTIDEREVVLLYVVQNLKHKDIASILNKPVGTVTWLYKTAMDKMRKGKDE